MAACAGVKESTFDDEKSSVQTIYIETSIVGFLRSRPSSQVVSAARQLLTQQWWRDERHNYELVTSQYVLDESSQGDPVLAAERLTALEGIPLLPISDAIPTLADELLAAAVLPAKARLDALHICAATFHRLDYLLTWNCSHIANARILPRIREVLRELGHELPVVCTPEEMVDDETEIEEAGGGYDYP